jgi:hypothetical protein
VISDEWIVTRRCEQLFEHSICKRSTWPLRGRGAYGLAEFFRPELRLTSYILGFVSARLPEMRK